MRELVLQRSRCAASVFRQSARFEKTFFFLLSCHIKIDVHVERKKKKRWMCCDAATATVFKAETATLVLEFWHIHLENIPLWNLNIF